MFDKQYKFTGTHADMVDKLTKVLDEAYKVTLFEYKYDVYINAPLIGYLFNHKGTKNNIKDQKDVSIFAEQMIGISDQLKYILRLILLLDKNYEPDEEKRLDKAFRKLGQEPKDLELFDAYLLGGVEVLYKALVATPVTDTVEYINRMYEFVEEFNMRFNSQITNKDILSLCNSGNI